MQETDQAHSTTLEACMGHVNKQIKEVPSMTIGQTLQGTIHHEYNNVKPTNNITHTANLLQITN